MDLNELKEDAKELLRQLIATPSFSREEDKTALIIENFLQQRGVDVKRHLNNAWAVNQFFDSSKPTILVFA